MVWSEYLRTVAPDAQQREIAQAAGVDQATVSRWRRTEAPPRPENVAAFARAFDRPVLEAFVAAGFLSASEANERPRGRPRLELITDTELLTELSKRLGVLRNSTQVKHDFGLAAYQGDPLIGHEELPHEA